MTIDMHAGDADEQCPILYLARIMLDARNLRMFISDDNRALDERREIFYGLQSDFLLCQRPHDLSR